MRLYSRKSNGTACFNYRDAPDEVLLDVIRKIGNVENTYGHTSIEAALALVKIAEIEGFIRVDGVRLV
jgi:hypothetical protein